MNAAEAQARIEFYCPAGDDPTLSSADMAVLLTLAAAVDADGYAPSDAEWTATYSVRGCLYAAREGWIKKKGKVVGRFDFTTDDQQFRRSQIADHIDEQIRLLTAKLPQSVNVHDWDEDA